MNDLDKLCLALVRSDCINRYLTLNDNDGLKECAQRLDYNILMNYAYESDQAIKKNWLFRFIEDIYTEKEKYKKLSKFARHAIYCNKIKSSDDCSCGFGIVEQDLILGK